MEFSCISLNKDVNEMNIGLNKINRCTRVWHLERRYRPRKI